jgi:hypothetical protein
MALASSGGSVLDTITAVNAALVEGIARTGAKLVEHQAWLKAAFAALRADFFP